LRAALCALLLALAVWPLAVRADDFGPRHDVRAIRHDLPILLSTGAATLTSISEIRITGVVIDGNGALAQYDLGVAAEYVAYLERIYDRWWLLESFSPFQLTTDNVGERLFKLAASNLPAVREATEPTPTPFCGKGYACGGLISGVTQVTPGSPSPRSLTFRDNGVRQRIDWDTYRAWITPAASDADADATIADIKARKPTQAESWANPPGGNSYFFFSGTVQAKHPVHVQAGTTIEVWFPFVLDPSLRYSLTIAAPNAMSLGPVAGTLKDNTLHFVLPAFTAPPGADLMGEIESN
jgi:hypothetical protein